MPGRKSPQSSLNGIKRREFLKIAAAAAVGVAVPVLAQVQTDIGTLDKEEAAKAFPSKPPYSPYAGRDFPTRPFFGDTHLHTSFSFDAGAFGARLNPADGYRFAKGQEVVASSGQRAKLSRPLDFMAVTDHSDNMGFFPDLLAGRPEILADPAGRRWYDMIQSGKGAEAAVEMVVAFSQGNFPKKLLYLPGTSRTAAPGGKRSRRRTRPTSRAVSRRSSVSSGPRTPAATTCIETSFSAKTANKASLVEPLHVYPPMGSDNPRDLWKWMARYEEKTGSEVLALAHNGNLSNGRMFPIIESFTGKPIDRAYAEEPHAVGAALRGDADQGRRRDASVPLAQR